MLKWPSFQEKLGYFLVEKGLNSASLGQKGAILPQRANLSFWIEILIILVLNWKKASFDLFEGYDIKISDFISLAGNLGLNVLENHSRSEIELDSW